MRSLLVVALAVSSVACEQKAAPPASTAETSSPKDSPVAYRVLRDELDNGTADYDVLVDGTTKHDDVDALLKYLYRHLMTRGDDAPAGVAAAVYNSEAAWSTPPRTPIATVIKKPSDRAPTFENKVPLEFKQQISVALGDHHDAGFTHKIVATPDEAQHAVAVTYPYTESGKDEWAASLSFNQALQAFADTARALFGDVPELQQLTFSGVWKDKEVVKVSMTRADYAAADLPGLEERIGSLHGRTFLAMQTGKEANMSPEKANAAAAKEQNASVAKEYRATLAKLKGKATVAANLK